MIPKIIHQICIPPALVAPKMVENMDILKAKNPKWQHRLYNDDDVKGYLKEKLGPRELQVIKKLNPKYSVVLADLVRYLLVYYEGGVYLDLKSTARKPLDEVLTEQDTYILSQWPNKLGQLYQGSGIYPELVRVPGGEFQQWHVIASPRHPFLKNVIETTLFNCANYHPKWAGVGKIGVLRISGPICYTLAIAPIRFFHQHRIVDAAQLGLEYTIFPKQGNAEYHSRSANHYSRQVEPIFTMA